MHEVLVNCLFKLAQEKSVVRLTDRPAMTIAVDLGQNKLANWKYILGILNSEKMVCL